MSAQNYFRTAKPIALLHMALSWCWVMGLGGTTPASAQAAASAYTMGYRWDAMHRLTGTIAPDPDGAGTLTYAAVRYTYDVDGQLLTAETGTLSAWQADTVAPAAWTGFTVLETKTRSYDAVGNVLQEKLTTAAGGSAIQTVTQTSYDEDDRAYCVANRMNMASIPALPSSYNKTFSCVLGTAGSFGQDRITKTIYDAAGEVVQVRKAVATSAPALEQAYATYAFTANGKQADVIDANGNHALMTYDGFDRPGQWRFPSATRPSSFDATTPASALTTAGTVNVADYEEYGYDPNGNRISLRKRDGQVIAYGFDALDRMVTKDLAGTAADVTYVYDLVGRQLSAKFTATGLGITNVYDRADRLTSSANNTIGTGRTLSYLYDSDGNRIRITHPDGTYFTTDYDGLDRATTIRENGSVELATLSYDALGRRSGLVRGGGVDTTTYGYDAGGRLSTLAHDLSGTAQDVSYTLAYNPASQIVTKTVSNDFYAYRGSVNASSSYVSNGLNQYGSVAGSTYGYDGNGNLTSDSATTYAYDAENRLVSASGARTGTAVYDPTGRLFQTSGGVAGVVRMLYDGDALVGEYDSSGALLRRYVHGPGADEPIVWYEGSAISTATRRYLSANSQGSVIAVADSSGTLIAANTYDPFGVANTANIGRFQYTGQIALPEFGVYHYKARAYSPTLNRFFQIDPVGYSDQINLYAYVANDPVNQNDPAGMYECQGAGKSGTSGCTFVAALYKGLQAESKAKGQAGTEAQKRLETLGAPGVKNGVVVKIGDAGGSSAFADATSKGKGTITFDPRVVEQNAQKGGFKAAFVDAIGTLGHEVGHLEDGPIRSGDIPSVLTTERRGYTFDALTAQAFNQSNVLWHPGITPDQEQSNIDYYAHRSCEVGQQVPQC